MTTKECLKLAGVRAIFAFMSAAALATLLISLANLGSGRPLVTDSSRLPVFDNGLEFCLFRLPITFSFGVPVYFLFRHFHLLRVRICVVTSAVVALTAPVGRRRQFAVAGDRVDPLSGAAAARSWAPW